MSQSTDEIGQELPVQAGYAAWSSCYDDDGNPLIALEGPAVRARFGPIGGRRAIDLGCGTGRHTEALVDAGARVVALDFTPEMITQARRKLRSRPVGWVRHSLLDPLPFRDGTFDLAILGLVLEHLEQLEPVFAELARVLAVGGRAVVSSLHPDRTGAGQRARFIDPATGLRQPVVGYHHEITEYLGAASAAGFEIETEQALTGTAADFGEGTRGARYVGVNLGWVAAWVKSR